MTPLDYQTPKNCPRCGHHYTDKLCRRCNLNFADPKVLDYAENLRKNREAGEAAYQQTLFDRANIHGYGPVAGSVEDWESGRLSRGERFVRVAPASGAFELQQPQGALSRQVGGNHYKDFAIQPVEFCQRNELGYCESNIIKYVCRHKRKGGKQDLEKVRHYIDLLIDMEYPE